MDRIGEQRKALADLVALLSTAVTDESAKETVEGLRTLQTTFDGISASYTFEKPVTDVASRTTFINSKSSVTITAEQLSAIAAQVSAIRSKILA
jgi:hypothetical protein